MKRLFMLWWTALLAAVLVGCGGGGGGTVDEPATSPGSGTATTTGTLQLSLTDNPSCGYDEVWITVERVRVHRSSLIDDQRDGGWIDIPLAAPLRVNLLELTNGILLPMPKVVLPAGTYSQVRLILAENDKRDPLANAVKPTGGKLVPLTTPSAQQSGLKLVANMSVPAGGEVEFAIDFDVCKSVHKAGKSGKYILNPVLSLIPCVPKDKVGLRIEGWVDRSIAGPGTTIAVQVNGEVKRATPPRADGSFVLYPVPVGTYDLVVTARDRLTAIVTGVPSVADKKTMVNGSLFPINPGPSSQVPVSGQITVGGVETDTGGFVRALQMISAGPTIEVSSASASPDEGLYAMILPTRAPIMAPYVAGAQQPVFVSQGAVAGLYQLSATVARSPEVKTADLVLGMNPVVQDFDWLLPATQQIEGWVATALGTADTKVSVQVNGEIVLSTFPDSRGRFVLSGVPVGFYTLVVTAPERRTAVVTGVPSSAAVATTVNSDAFPIDPSPSLRQAVGGVVRVGLSTTDTGGVVLAQQTMGLGPIVQVSRANADPVSGAYAMRLPIDAPIKAPYVEGASSLDFLPTLATAGQYRLWAAVARSPEVLSANVVLDDKAPVAQDFDFAAP